MNGDANNASLKRKRNNHDGGGGGGSSSSTEHQNTASSSAVSIDCESLISPNFEELARQFPDFGRAYQAVQQAQRLHNTQLKRKQIGGSSGGGSFPSFITPDFTVALTKALLHLHWGLTLTHLPSHEHLCPPVPNRYFYVQWIQIELLPIMFADASPTTRTTSMDGAQHRYDVNRCFVNRETRHLSCTGLDIGTGVTCIYPLLFAAGSACIEQDAISGSSMRQPRGWTLYASDVDANAIEMAKHNVHNNQTRLGLHIGIHPLLVAPSDRQDHFQHAVNPCHNPVGPLRRVREQWQLAVPLDFCMTNPPFYDDDDHLISSATGQPSNERMHPQRGDGRARTPMTASEGSYPGGEVGFVLDILLDGLYYYHIQPNLVPTWMSCMCGKKASWLRLRGIVTQLLGPAHVCSTEFGPGHLTRWFLAWTLEQPQLRSPLAKTMSWNFGVCLPNAGGIFLPQAETYIREVAQRLQEYCSSLRGWGFAVRPINASNGNANKGLTLEIAESIPIPPPDPSNDADHRLLPENLLRMLQQLDFAKRQAWLPPGGHHFVTDVFIAPPTINHNDVSTILVPVQVQAFSHSGHGTKAVQALRQPMEGEVCRTNRKWRRKLKQNNNDEQIMGYK